MFLFLLKLKFVCSLSQEHPTFSLFFHHSVHNLTWMKLSSLSLCLMSGFPIQIRFLSLQEFSSIHTKLNMLICILVLDPSFRFQDGGQLFKSAKLRSFFACCTKPVGTFFCLCAFSKPKLNEERFVQERYQLNYEKRKPSMDIL